MQLLIDSYFSSSSCTLNVLFQYLLASIVSDEMSVFYFVSLHWDMLFSLATSTMLALQLVSRNCTMMSLRMYFFVLFC